MASSLTTFDAFLKERYTSDKIDFLTYNDRPALEHIPKDASGSGDLFVHPVVYANPQGLASTLPGAQAGATQSGGGGNLKSKKWQVQWGDYSGAVEIGDKVIKASRDNVGSFLRNQSVEVDQLYEGFGDVSAFYVFANSGRAIVSTFTISSGVCTCSNKQDTANIEVGALIQASADDGTATGHSLLGSGSIGYVIAVNRNAGTFTVSASAGGSAGTPTGWTGTMYAFRNTDFGGTASPNAIFHGYGAWIPSSDPSSTAFNGVDRTDDITRLSGVRLTSVTGLGIEQRLKKLVTSMVGLNGGKGPTHLYLNPDNWQSLADSLESRGYRMADGGEAKFNYSKLRLAMGGKMVEIYADRFCPVNEAFAIHMPCVKLRSIDKFPHVINGDGLTMLRKSSSNDFEYRIQAYPAMVVSAPGFCGRVTLPAVA